MAYIVNAKTNKLSSEKAPVNMSKKGTEHSKPFSMTKGQRVSAKTGSATKSPK